METKVIPRNMEKYMASMLGEHLYKLACNLSDEKFEYTSEVFKNEQAHETKSSLSIWLYEQFWSI